MTMQTKSTPKIVNNIFRSVRFLMSNFGSCSARGSSFGFFSAICVFYQNTIKIKTHRD